MDFLKEAWEAYVNYDPMGAATRYVDTAKKDHTEQLDRIINDPANFDAAGDYKGGTNRFGRIAITPEAVKNRKLDVAFSNLTGRNNSQLMADAKAAGVTPKRGDTKESVRSRIDYNNTLSRAQAIQRRLGDQTDYVLGDNPSIQQLNDYIKNTQPMVQSLDVDATPAGQRQITTFEDGLKTTQSSREATAESIKASQAATRINQGTLDLAQTQARNAQALALSQIKTDNYRYEDSKAERAIERQYDADREAARFAAQAETVRLQNDADMERYQLMLENERQKSQGDTISELMASLTMLGGAFMI